MELETIAGIEIMEAFRKLDYEMEPNAYKKIEGGKAGRMNLTDINPGYLPTQLLEIFGPLGFGWGYDLICLESELNDVVRASGKADKEWRARATVAIWYRLRSGEEVFKSDPISAPGGSTNTQQEWAEKGAITCALGAAWFFAGYQVSVYQNKRSHESVRKPKPQQRKPETKTATDISNELKACKTLAELGKAWKDNLPHRAKLLDTEKQLLDAMKEELKIKLTPASASNQ